MNLVRCQDCAHFNLRDSHLKHLGFGLCKVLSTTKGHTFSAHWPKDCEHFLKAEAVVIERRKAVLEGR